MAPRRAAHRAVMQQAQSGKRYPAGPWAEPSLRQTATEDRSDEQRCAEAAAGLAGRFDTDTTGPPATPFRPDPAG
jgi:hypothetical protein